MKSLTLHTGALLALLVIGSAVRSQTDSNKDALTPKGKLTTEYDRFEEKTKVALDDMKLQTPPGSALLLFLRGEFSGKPKPPSTIGFSIGSLSMTGYDRPARCNLDIIADGAHLKYSLTRYHEAMYLMIFYAQAFRIDLPYANFSQIAKSRSVEMRFCDTEFKLTAEQLAQLGEFRKHFGDEDK